MSKLTYQRYVSKAEDILKDRNNYNRKGELKPRHQRRVDKFVVKAVRSTAVQESSNHRNKFLEEIIF